MLTVSPVASPSEPAAVRPDAGGGAGFAPLIAGLLASDAPPPDGAVLPVGGEKLPVVPVSTDLPPAPVAAAGPDVPAATPLRFTAVPAGERAPAAPRRATPEPAAMPVAAPSPQYVRSAVRPTPLASAAAPAAGEAAAGAIETAPLPAMPDVSSPLPIVAAPPSRAAITVTMGGDAPVDPAPAPPQPARDAIVDPSPRPLRTARREPDAPTTAPDRKDEQGRTAPAEPAPPSDPPDPAAMAVPIVLATTFPIPAAVPDKELRATSSPVAPRPRTTPIRQVPDASSPPVDTVADTRPVPSSPASTADAAPLPLSPAAAVLPSNIAPVTPEPAAATDAPQESSEVPATIGAAMPIRRSTRPTIAAARPSPDAIEQTRASSPPIVAGWAASAPAQVPVDARAPSPLAAPASIDPIASPTSPTPSAAPGTVAPAAAVATRTAAEPNATPPTDMAGRSDAPPRSSAAAPIPTPQPEPRAILPALQAFGAAIRQALAEQRKPAASATEPIAELAAMAAPVAAAPVATATAGDAALDTADRRWPHAMAPRIEQLRDAAADAQGDMSATRIRLLPDALGPVDVSVRRDGEQVHVHFAAADPGTRQLLADAQPRLADAADARGLKLGRTDVSTGTSLADGERQPQQRPAPQAPLPARPAPTRAAPAAADADTRIA